jgi:hypothetical protein
MKERIFPIIITLSALLVSASAAFYSKNGLIGTHPETENVILKSQWYMIYGLNRVKSVL